MIPAMCNLHNAPRVFNTKIDQVSYTKNDISMPLKKTSGAVICLQTPRTYTSSNIILEKFYCTLVVTHLKLPGKSTQSAVHDVYRHKKAISMVIDARKTHNSMTYMPWPLAPLPPKGRISLSMWMITSFTQTPPECVESMI